MTMTIRPVSTIEFIGLSETNTIGYITGNNVASPTFQGMQQSRPSRRVFSTACPSNCTFQYIPSSLQSLKLLVFTHPWYTRIAS
jgi:hypothetical protein